MSCTNETEQAHQISDEAFAESLVKDSHYKTIEFVDSLISENKTGKIKLGLLYLQKGQSLSGIRNEKEAVESYEKALSHFPDNEAAKKYIAKTYMLMGSSNIYLSKTEIATTQVLMALEIAQEIDEKIIEAGSYNVLAHLHFTLGDYLQAIGYTLQSSEIQTLSKDTIGLSGTYNNLAVLYRNIGDFDNALKYNMKSLNLNEQLNLKGAISKSYNNIGLVLDQMNDFEKAETYFLKSIKEDSLNSSPLINLGNLFFRLKNYDKSKVSFLKALKIENPKSRFSKQKEIYDALLKIAIIQQDLDGIININEKLTALGKAQVKSENEDKLKSMEREYQFMENQKKIKQEQEINTKNKIIFIAVVVLLFTVSLLIFQKNKNKRLQLSQEKLRLEQTVLRAQMNPHFIFNTLSSIQNSLLDNDPLKSATYLSRFSKLIRQNFDYINQSKITLEEELDLLRNYMDTQKFRFEEKFDYFINVSDTISPGEMTIPPLLLQPFVENSIEHGFKNKKDKGLITINISGTQNRISYEITDNGSGFSKSVQTDKQHAIDVFKKRMRLLDKKDTDSFTIESSEKGTKIKFELES